MRSGWKIAVGLAALALVGCHGATIIEASPDGGAAGAGTGGGNAGTSGSAGRGGTTGTAGVGAAGSGGTTGIAGTGGAGRGGTTGTGGAAGNGGNVGTAGRGGTAGSGCAAQMTPQMFYRGGSAPVYTAATATRFYWVEYGSPNITIHYTAASTPAEITHPLALGAAGIGNYDVTASDTFVVATWGGDGQIAVWGPDSNSTQLGRMTLTYPSAVAVDGATVFYSYQPQTGSGTQGIYTWSPPGTPATLFESYSDLVGDRTLGLLLRVTPTKLLLSDKTDIWFVDRAAKGAKQVLFNNPTTRLITEVRPARPRTADGPVVVTIDDPILLTGRDYYVNLSQPSATPKDLGAATTALANASACGNAAVFNGVGVMYQQRYIYEGNGGLFAVDVSTSGTVSNLVRLTDVPFSYPDVTEAGDLFAGTVYNVSKWDYYRIGKL